VLRSTARATWQRRTRIQASRARQRNQAESCERVLVLMVHDAIRKPRLDGELQKTNPRVRLATGAPSIET